MMVGSRMFSNVTHTHNLMKYCDHDCVYCWANEYGKTDKNPQIIESRLKKKFGRGDVVFLDSCGDLFCQSVPAPIIVQHLKYVANNPDATFLICTKNPRSYQFFVLPENLILGATIETDLNIRVSKAPSQPSRLDYMNRNRRDGYELPYLNDHQTLISIEPILNFSDLFAYKVLNCRPSMVFVGYNSRHQYKLPEPSLTETLKLIQYLRDNGITVYEKEIRKAWWEQP